MQSETILSEQPIEEFCHRWRVAKLTLDKDRLHREKQSDIGLRIKFDPSAEWSLADRLRMNREFETLTGHSLRLRSERSSVRNRRPMRVLYNS
jgi:hypothetical protein